MTGTLKAAANPGKIVINLGVGSVLSDTAVLKCCLRIKFVGPGITRKASTNDSCILNVVCFILNKCFSSIFFYFMRLLIQRGIA